MHGSLACPAAGAVPGATITVSGYAPVHAYAANGATGSARAMRYEDLEAFDLRRARVLDGHSPGGVARCHGCRVWGPRVELADDRLGFDTYCARCVGKMAARCQARNGRLPGVGEFYCAACETIRPEALRTPPDADGRRRFRCRPCRRAQVRRAELRHRARDGA